ALLAVVGAWLMLPALHFGAEAAAMALLLPIVAWSWMLARFGALIATSTARERAHAFIAAFAVGMGIVGLLAARLWLLTGRVGCVELAETVGLWGFVVPLFAAVSHRMIPFFTAN